MKLNSPEGLQLSTHLHHHDGFPFTFVRHQLLHQQIQLVLQSRQLVAHLLRLDLHRLHQLELVLCLLKGLVLKLLKLWLTSLIVKWRQRETDVDIK